MNHFIPNHILEYKTAAFQFLLNRKHQLPLSLGINKDNAIRYYTLLKHMDSLYPYFGTQHRKSDRTSPLIPIFTTLHRKYNWHIIHGLLIRKLTHLFRNTNLKIKFRSTNIIRKTLHTGLTTVLQNIKLTFTIWNGKHVNVHI